MSTSPWTPTRRFAHPLAYFRASTEVEQEVQNYLSYTLIEESIWQECYHVVDHFRRAILGLPGLPLNGGGGVLRNLNVPHTYLWTSALVPAPNDWERTINIGGYIPTTTQALPYNPPNELTQFLESTPAPIFVSLDISLLQSPERFVRCVKEASEKYGLAFLLPSTFHSVSGISEDSKLFVLHDVPIAIFKAGLGPPPVHEKDFSCESLVMAIRQCLQPEVRENARAIANKMKTEDGVARTVRLFHRYMNWDAMQCSFSQEDVATFRICDNPSVQLSSVAAVILLNAKGLRWSELEFTDEKPEGSISKCDTSRSATSMSVGKDLIKAIAKPTFSHIADACNGIEV
ncbi:hypothetical protein PENANT_c004G05317 [Penicillium antarcticum]|uniref:Uncharacterized protein n=1 Tax=Penicillium antarcticum TaxID=416450 RepID=A0A1V6QHK3_9EURO|nr:hypothetical protein PENANT_c004G05317 [Penicillium antarcticum]